MRAMLDVGGDFKVGDTMPDGYIARQEWADAHFKAGLKQEICCHCCAWFFPHQLSDRRIISKAWTRMGVEVEMKSRICLECDKKHDIPKITAPILPRAVS